MTVGTIHELAGRRVAIIGLGASGVAAARLALDKGGDVYASDLRSEAAAPAGGADLRALGADVEWGGHDLARLAAADLVVVSPGIPPDAPVLRFLAERGVAWISEPEFAVRFFRGPLIAVTGTNGKTSTSVLTAHLLETAGVRVLLGGNVGGGIAPAASALAAEDAPQWYVLELSSFQLRGVRHLRPDIGVFTNLSPDHLDYYETVDEYYADKARLFRQGDASTRWVLPHDDAAVAALAADAPGARFSFTARSDEGAAAAVRDDGTLVLRVRGEETLLPASELPLLGGHNVRNALAAALTARLAGVRAQDIARGLAGARPLPHRLEPVAERGGVLWVNDSKATNVAATVSALASLDRPVILLAGGKDKGESFAPLLPAMSRVRAVVAYGAAGPRLAGTLEGSVAVHRERDDFSAVVRRAAGLARPGDIVLLSPACSSFDMFSSYVERGDRFRALVREEA